MLRIIQSTSAAAAKSYYTEGLSKEDYYSEGQEIAGEWGGLLAKRLGLSGQVDKAAANGMGLLPNSSGESRHALYKARSKIGKLPCKRKCWR